MSQQVAAAALTVGVCHVSTHIGPDCHHRRRHRCRCHGEEALLCNDRTLYVIYCEINRDDRTKILLFVLYDILNL